MCPRLLRIKLCAVRMRHGILRNRPKYCHYHHYIFWPANTVIRLLLDFLVFSDKDEKP